jgi:RNA polymerase sigma-70 factor (ECF subfamily)
MDEQAFQFLYARTARPLRSYLGRVSGDPALADDLLQETYYRFLRARLPAMEEAHRKNYLFRIAANLLRDHFRSKRVLVPLPELPNGHRTSKEIHLRSDLGRILQELPSRDRSLLWLAYAEGFSHREMAEILGLKEKSIRVMLFRARKTLAAMLRRRGLGAEVMS